MTKKINFRELDGLRGIFILLIVVMHVKGAFDYAFSSVLRPVYDYGGYFGNYMFFLLSGFLMGYWYSERIRKSGSDPESSMSFWTFMKKRLLRIYPLYFLTNVVCIIIDFCHLGAEALDVRRMLLTFCMMCTGWIDDTRTPYNGVGWFVNVLMVCYLLFYLICWLGRKHKTVFYVLAAAAVLAGHAFMVLDLHVPFCFRTNGEGYLNFFAGVLLAQVFMAGIERSEDASSGWKRREIIAVIAGVLNLLIVVGCILVGGLSNATSDIPTTVALMCFLLLITVLYGRGLRAVFGNPVFVFLGKISMSVFLWHLPILNILQYTGDTTHFNFLDTRVQFAVFIVLVLILSWLSYRFLEDRLRKVMGRILRV